MGETGVIAGPRVVGLGLAAGGSDTQGVKLLALQQRGELPDAGRNLGHGCEQVQSQDESHDGQTSVSLSRIAECG